MRLKEERLILLTIRFIKKTRSLELRLSKNCLFISKRTTDIYIFLYLWYNHSINIIVRILSMNINEQALKKHYEWGGKIEVYSRIPVESR